MNATSTFQNINIFTVTEYLDTSFQVKEQYYFTGKQNALFYRHCKVNPGDYLQ